MKRHSRKGLGFLNSDEIMSVLRQLGYKPKPQTPTVEEVVEEVRGHEYIRAIQDKLGIDPEQGYVRRTTYDGYPFGDQVHAGQWRVSMSASVYTRLMQWDAERQGLELSGYALLTERPLADPEDEHVFEIDDIKLICVIEESSGGYTEMSPQQRVQGMMWATEKGRSANCLVWWHIHPIGGWSSIDENTLRQRVHETGLNEQLCTFSFVLTPVGIRARWDQANPNIFVDEIPVYISEQEEASAQIAELFGDTGSTFHFPDSRLIFHKSASYTNRLDY